MFWPFGFVISISTDRAEMNKCAIADVGKISLHSTGWVLLRKETCEAFHMLAMCTLPGSHYPSRFGVCRECKIFNNDVPLRDIDWQCPHGPHRVNDGVYNSLLRKPAPLGRR